MNIVQSILQVAKQPLETALSLPFDAYTHPDFLAAECQSLFQSEWVFACMAGELANPGDYYALTIGTEPILILRTNDGEFRAFANICRHRGTVLVDDGFGHIDKYITCPYHAWAYDTSGQLKAVPHNQRIVVDRSEHQLIQFQAATWLGLVFVNLDDKAPPLSERLRGLDAYLEFFEPQSFDQVRPGEVETWQANWKLAMENAMESYHLFKVHEQTLERYSPTRDAYYVAGSTEWSLTGGATQRKKGLLERLLGSKYSDLYDHYLLISIPPSFVGVLSYGSLGWLSAHPLDTRRTRIRSGATATGDSVEGLDDSNAFTRAFFEEDRAICERVQRGMDARLSRGGKLVDMERVVVDFHQYLASRMGAAAPTPLFEDEAAATWRANG